MAKLKFKGTKTDWIKKYDSIVFIDEDFEKKDCDFYKHQYEDIEEMHANMQLIISSKSLLEALQELLSLHNNEMEGIPPTPEEWYEAVKKGEKAIEKALKY